MKVMIDLDGVICNFESNVALVANKLWPNAPLPPDYRPRDWDYSDVFDKEHWDLIWAEIKTIPDFWVRAEPIAENVLALRAWMQESEHDIFFITSRQETGNQTAYKQTVFWLEIRHLLNCPTRVIAVKKPSEKKEWVSKFGIDFSIDDYAPTVAELNTVPNHKSYLLDQPWNHQSNQPRVYSLQEFLGIVDGAHNHSRAST